MGDLTRLYSSGRVGMTVVLDRVSLSGGPFAKYQQPAFFTIVEDLTPEERFNGDYVLQDQEGNRIPTTADPEDKFATNASSYLTDVSVWSAWKADNYETALAAHKQSIHDLAVRVAILKEVMATQGVRVITNEQAKALGIKA
jgi:hypothetical protein